MSYLLTYLLMQCRLIAYNVCYYIVSWKDEAELFFVISSIKLARS